MKKALVCGAGGFIGGHLVKRLKDDGYWVSGVDIKEHEYNESAADKFSLSDLRDPLFCKSICENIQFDELYQLAADMGGAGYLFTGENDAAVMHNSALINLNMSEQAKLSKIPKVFYSSSACVYPESIQMESNNKGLKESDVYPAAPDSEYGWEKLFSERLYLSYMRNHGIKVKIARFHNIFGPYGTWDGGKEKVPAAICRKVADSPDGGEIEIWGDGEQTRTFLYVDECIDGIRRLMESDLTEVVNIGSDQLISINVLAEMLIGFSEKKLKLKHITGPIGVRGRSSDNTSINEKLNWKPSWPLSKGMRITYDWINSQVNAK
jgi:GDP-D-mannose 3', 5'-epimerase